MSAQSDRIIALSAFGTFGFTFVDSLSDKGRKEHGTFPSTYHAKLFVGTGIAFIGCAAIAEVAPDLGATFALAIFATVFVTSGATVLNNVLALTGG